MPLEMFPRHSQEIWGAGQSLALGRLGLGYSYILRQLSAQKSLARGLPVNLTDVNNNVNIITADLITLNIHWTTIGCNIYFA